MVTFRILAGSVVEACLSKIERAGWPTPIRNEGSASQLEHSVPVWTIIVGGIELRSSEGAG